MADLESLTHDRFAACLDQPFVAAIGEEKTIELLLFEVKRRGGSDPARDRREPFSLLFRGPLAPVLPQQIYPLGNETLGEVALFLVPIGPDADGMVYEAVFN